MGFIQWHPGADKHHDHHVDDVDGDLLDFDDNDEHDDVYDDHDPIDVNANDLFSDEIHVTTFKC